MTDLSIRPATEEDLPFLLDLRRATMTPHLIASGIEPSDEIHRERVLAHFDCAGIVSRRPGSGADWARACSAA